MLEGSAFKSTGRPIARNFPMTRVLLLEDCVDLLDVLQLEMQNFGYEVDAVADADHALLAAQHARPDVIVSDLGLPGIGGLEFIRRIREMPGLASVPAIALTGSGLDRDVQQALACGFTAHLLKPVEPTDLANRIEQLTARRLYLKAS
jgi:two-component system CheB/CheR fusion protein